MHRALPHFFAALLSVLAMQATATPFVPASDAQVLEHLPFKPSDPIAREMAAWRAQLQREPKNAELAVKLAQRYYGLVAEEGDPRYLGYAQAALAPWWDMAAPPDDIQVLRASLRQFRHDFTGSVQDLDAVIARSPQNAQARALRATIHIVQARYAQGRSDCSALRGISRELIASGCEAMVGGLTGHSALAYRRLNDVLQKESEAGDPSRSDQLWILLRLAEMAQRLGRTDEAQAHYKQALSLGIVDTFLFAAYADFLLDQQRAAEIPALLGEKTRSDTLLLRLVLAEHGLKTAAAQQHQATLASRYAAAQMRGDTVHQQEEARFALHIENNPQKALKLAQENWKVQREPRDARIFLEAAVALNDAAGAQPVLQWLAESHIEDRILLRLAQKLQSQPQKGSK